MIIVAIFCLSLVLMIAASALSDNKKPNVKDNSILTLDFRTGIIDSPSEDTQELFSFSEKEKNVLIFDILKAIKNAKTDDKIKGISIETDGLKAGMTHLDDIRNALEDLKKVESLFTLTEILFPNPLTI